MIKRFAVLSAVVLFGFAAVACEKADEAGAKAADDSVVADDSKPSEERTRKTELDEADFPKSPTDKPILALLGAGSGTRQPLRLAPKVGVRQASTMALNGDFAGQRMDMKIDLVGEVKKVNPDGSFDVVGSFGDVDMNMGGLDAQGKAMVKNMLKDMGMNWTFSARGDIEHQEITGSMAGMMDQSFAQLFLSLPKDAVGVGATWTVNDKLTQNGMTIMQQIHYKVLAINGSKVDLEMDIRQKANPQTVGGIQLDSLESTGKGVIVVDTTMPLPRKMKLDLTMDMSMSMGGQKQSNTSKFTFDWSDK